MSRLKPIQFNFTAGELAPRLYGASHLAKYWNAVETLENFIILPYGGVQRRDGLHFVCAQGDETRKVRLIPFIFSTEQAYIIEAGHEYMRFFMNHGQILATVDADTVLLLHMNGTDGSQTFTDSSAGAHTVTANTTVQIDTDKSKFGGASGLFTKLDLSYLRVPDHADFNFSADDVFTIEANIYQTTLQTGVICSQYTDADNKYRFMVWADGSVEFSVWHTAAVQSLQTAISKLTVNTWHHIRVVGDGTNYYLFVDGIKLVESAITKSMQDYTGDLLIGTSTGIVAYYGGWMDEFRISDAARSVADFVPPDQEYPITGAAAEIVSPYLEGDLPLLKYFQSYDTMYLFHPDHAWRKLTRTAHATWSLDEVEFTNGPWLDEETGTVFSVSAVTGDIDITSDIDFFLDGHVDALLRLNIGGNWGHVKITAVTNTTTATATVLETLFSTADTDSYQEGAWSAVRGYPSCGMFNEESLMAAANDNQPQTVWASQKGDWENFEAGTDDADAFIYTIPASNRILWLGSLREMIMGAGDGIYKMTGGMDDYISPTNVRVKPGMAIGAKSLGPVPVNNSLLYWQKGGRKLRELTYDPNSFDEGYVAPDLTLLSDHITLSGVKYSAWQQEPNSVFWTVRTDGVMLSMTYMRPEEVVGWGRHITDGVIESVAVIPDPTDTYNEAWVSVKRDIAAIDSDTVLLLRMNGTDESTSFPDASAGAHTVTAVGAAEIDTSQSKFGGASGSFVAGNLTIPDSSDFDFSADDIFTIETFVRIPALIGAEHGIFCGQTDDDNGIRAVVLLDGTLRFEVGNLGVWQQLESAAAAISVDTWYHVRAVGDGTNYYLFLDGILIDSGAITQSTQNYTGLFYVGKRGDYFYLAGWLDQFKVSDAARSTTDFTPPEVEGEIHRYIEFMDPDMMVDSGLIYSGGDVSSVSGLGHLEGETVDIVADGVVYTQQVVSNGIVTISPAASEIQIGLPYTSKLVTVKPTMNVQDGTTAGLPKKWAELFVSVHETSGLTINSGGTDEIIDFRAFSDVGLGEAIPLYSGDVRVSQLGWVDGRVTIEHDDPLPCTILGVFGVLEIGN